MRVKGFRTLPEGLDAEPTLSASRRHGSETNENPEHNHSINIKSNVGELHEAAFMELYEQL